MTMRRKQLIDTTHKIQQAISDSELLERLHVRILALSKQGKKVPNVGDLLAALNKFSISTSKLSDAEKEVLKQLDLHYLNDPKNWPKLISTDQPELLKSIFSNLRRLRSSLGYFQKVISIGHDELNDINSNDETLSILLLADENTKDTPKKIASTLESIQQLYNCFVTLEHIDNPQDLTIIGMDSGNEKSIELTGESIVLEKMKELLYGVWMQVLPSHNQYLSEQLKLILKSLPILERIEELATTGQIEKEKAALAKRQLTTSLEDLIRSNTIIEEMYDHWQQDPRVAMQLTPRLTTQQEKSITSEEAPEFATQQRTNPFMKNEENELIATTNAKTAAQKVTSLNDGNKLRFIQSKKAEASE